MDGVNVRGGWTRHWVLIVFLFALAGLGLIYVILSGTVWARVASALLVVVPVAWSVAQYSYSHVERYRLLIDGARARLQNHNVVWGITAEYQIRAGKSTLAWKAVQEALPEGREQIPSTTASYAAVLKNGIPLTARVMPWMDPLQGERHQIIVRLHPTTGTLRFWKRLIDDELIPTLRRIESAVAHYNEDSFKYSVDVIFEELNPYFGYFVARVERGALQRFDVAYYEEAAQERALVEVRDTRLSFVTRSLDAAGGLMRRFLVLAPPKGG